MKQKRAQASEPRAEASAAGLLRRIVHIPRRLYSGASEPAVSACQGIVAPKGAPASVVDTLNREINLALTDPKLNRRLAEPGTAVLPGSPADFAKLIMEDTQKRRK